MLMSKAKRAKTALYIFDGKTVTARSAMPLSITRSNVLIKEWHVFGDGEE